ncbi:hypothetical protein [Micavibrio aeruginosavorus]|uniref:Uncharacterized protein n=1 Tax=Micavibrio aeruginosavorus EPB TaxID=349215 RepID=M4VG16_9BACT|nr:hypothetical protein [Micavibrio aeruginosavorus]AGH98327.1 hypothetical protein A11S_1521 [Micavibrio aeruginosavorus EPB]
MLSLKSIFQPVANFFVRLEIKDQESRIEAAKAGKMFVPMEMRGPWSVVNGLRDIDPQTAQSIIKQSEQRIKELRAKLG